MIVLWIECIVLLVMSAFFAITGEWLGYYLCIVLAAFVAVVIAQARR